MLTGSGLLAADEVDRQLATRLDRQELLGRARPPQLTGARWRTSTRSNGNGGN